MFVSINDWLKEVLGEAGVSADVRKARGLKLTLRMVFLMAGWLSNSTVLVIMEDIFYGL